MVLFDVEKILDKCIGEKKQEMFLLKWKHLKRPKWTPKSDLNCHRLVIDFETANGPTILAAKRDSANGIQYLVQMKGEPFPKILTSSEAKTGFFFVPIILYLQTKIQWQDGVSQNRNVNVVLAGESPKKVLYAARSLNGLMYFFECEPQNINIMPAESAIVNHPELVLNFLEECMENYITINNNDFNSINNNFCVYSL